MPRHACGRPRTLRCAQVASVHSTKRAFRYLLPMVVLLGVVHTSWSAVNGLQRRGMAAGPQGQLLQTRRRTSSSNTHLPAPVHMSLPVGT